MITTTRRKAVHWLLLLLAAGGIAGLSEYAMQQSPSRHTSIPTQQDSSEPVAEQPSAPPSSPAPVPKTEVLSDRIVEYHMNVELAAETKELKGSQSVTWRNPGSQPVQEVYLHLYANAFESRKTTFMRESGGQLRGDKAKSDSFGRIDLQTIRTEDGTDLSSRMRYVQPDDGNKDDRTLLQVKLPKPVGPGQSVTLRTEFLVKLPSVFARMGYVDDFVMAGQWFPKLAAYETAGTRGRSADGWNLHQYHGNSEFYSNFGIYDVRIKVPSAYTVAATGFPTKPAVDDGAVKTYQFYADDVHDFGWAASPHFKYYEEPYSTTGVPGVKIKLYLDPAHDAFKARYMTAAKKALARYSSWYGPYPYSTLSIVVPPEGGNGAGGMEYPTLITSWAAGKEEPDLELERVVVHEIGHQYWYGMVASNEFEEAWLDEGFTSYAEDNLMASEYGSVSNLPIQSSYITTPAALKENAWEYPDHDVYADNVYTRAKLVLTAIEKQIGKDQMDRVLKTYFQRWKFKHPSTQDFQTVLEEVTKAKWDDFFDQYVYGGLMTDYSVDAVVSKPTGLGGANAYDNTIVLRRHGGTTPAVPIHVHFTDGRAADLVWDGKGQQTDLKVSSAAPVDWVMIDPSHQLVLENRHINNYLRTSIDPVWSVRWNLGATQLVEAVLRWIAW
ncbi:M1 family metallopeptidase [Paenibacillus chartarius]|uniref:M1 family metallopeptidase n=1 Tax=Paenibacillus chartarius TaxID=747481 RepID=A0ABV6DS70_9BACL